MIALQFGQCFVGGDDGLGVVGGGVVNSSNSESSAACDGLGGVATGVVAVDPATFNRIRQRGHVMIWFDAETLYLMTVAQPGHWSCRKFC
ncbi:MAG: hypothetical protein R3C99_14690 [Pirellulaceae bacterium]